MRQVGRRRFLCCVGGASALAGLSSALAVRTRQEPERKTAARENPHNSELQSVTRNGWALGSTVSMTVLHRRTATAELAIDAAFAELELIENLMSIYRPASQLSRLNRDGVLKNPHPYLLDVLHFANSISQQTQGAFDITIQPLWELYAAAQQASRLPSDAEIRAVRNLVDWKHVELAADFVRLDGAGTKITLNGIAQGFAADRVRETLLSHGIDHALIDTGEIGTLGTKPQDNGWMIGIQHPRDEDAYLSLTKLAGRCLATSGDYATVFGPDYKHHHLFNPRTGHSPTELSSVTIAANTALAADAISTATFVLGLDAGSRLIRDTPGTDAMLVSKEGDTVVTAGFPVART